MDDIPIKNLKEISIGGVIFIPAKPIEYTIEERLDELVMFALHGDSDDLSDYMRARQNETKKLILDRLHSESDVKLKMIAEALDDIKGLVYHQVDTRGHLGVPGMPIAGALQKINDIIENRDGIVTLRRLEKYE